MVDINDEKLIHCPNCGTDFPKEDDLITFCPNCGTEVFLDDEIVQSRDKDKKYAGEPIDKENVQLSGSASYCPFCGAAVEGDIEDYSFCPECGHAILDESNAEISATEPFTTTSSKDTWMQCPNCGALFNNTEETMFCPECGASLTTIVPPKKAKSPGKTAKIVLIVLLVLAAVGAGVYFAVIRPGNIYKEAIALANEGEYEDAYNKMKSLGNYKDSSQLADEYYDAYKTQVYFEAYGLISKGKYDDAINAFEKINKNNEYDSDISKCEEKIKDYIISYIASQKPVLNNQNWHEKKVTKWERDSKKQTATVGLNCSNDLMIFSYEGTFTYGYNDSGLYVIKAENIKDNSSLTGELPRDVFDYLCGLYVDGYYIYHTGAVKITNKNQYTIRLCVFDDYPYDDIYSDDGYSYYGTAYTFDVYDYTYRFDMNTGEWTKVQSKYVSDDLKIKNTYDPFVNVREYPGKKNKRVGKIEVNETARVDAFMPGQNTIDYDEEYDWWRLSDSSYWIADPINETWYIWVMD